MEADAEEPAAEEAPEGEAEANDEEEGGYDDQWPGYEGAEPEWEQPETALVVPQAEAAPAVDAGLAYPPPRGHWDASPVSRETALSYALNAQYWAGYWMGVARYAPADEETPQSQPPAKKQKQGASTLRR